mgnify:CR=1 FL=1
MRAPGTGGATLRFTLYGRSYCHLCDQMLAALVPLSREFDFSVDVVDVDSDAALEGRFGSLVPVLMHDGAELCHYHLDTARVRAYLGTIGGPGRACVR